MATMEQILKIKEREQIDLMKKKNVNGISIGFKETGGKKTGELSLVILVTNLVLSRLAEKEEILVKQMLAGASMAFTFLILISLVQNIRLVI